MSFSPFKVYLPSAVYALVSLFPAAGFSDSTRSTLDTGENMPQQITDIHSQVNEIHQVVVESPLAGKDWGVEVDPVLLLFTGSSAETHSALIYGTISNFSFQRTAELAFPFGYEYYGGSGAETVLKLDAAYRYFLSGYQRGFYISAFVRDEYEQWNAASDGYGDNYAGGTANRVGVGFGIGDRIFSRAGWYWGWSLSFGRFLGDNYDANGNTPDDNLGDLIFDAELLKVGFAF